MRKSDAKKRLSVKELQKPSIIRLVITFFLFILQVSYTLVPAYATPQKQTISPEDRALALLEQLRPEERVGQLFLVSFLGNDAGVESQIYDLIVNHHIGGVVLQAENDNFKDVENLSSTTRDLIRDLHQDKWIAAQQNQVDPDTQEVFTPAFIPLFVGISQPGDGYPYDQIYNDLTKLPSPMALGATWNPELSEQVGFVIGSEMSSMGINLLFGPSLDVIESPNPESSGDLGIRAFGGDPFWVGKMGSAFISGLHKGSQNKILAVGKHFPGHGGSDRPPEEEIATVRKSLEQLKQIELAPFFAVTGQSPLPEATVDALLISHIRYQGFQGNIRATTRPVSFDEQAFSTIINLPQFATWREEGGIIITDNLGSRAVRRFYDPGDLSFNARLVVRDAFLAGSDLLFLGNIRDTSDQDTYTTTIDILDFFTQKYREDLAFAQRVDESVLRILTLKYRIFPSFSLGSVIPARENLDRIGNNQQVTFEVAQQGATLISPSLSDLDTVLPDAPGINDRIVFFSDEIMFSQCLDCPQQTALAKDGFQQAIFRLYGPEAGNQVLRGNLSSFTFSDLQTILDTNQRGSPVESTLRGAQWIVFAMLDVRTERPESQALRRLLSERPELLQGKRVIAFAFNAPYYLDATDISKLTAYYALYNKSPQFIDIAARILFKEFTPTTGASPVSVPGIGYDLISATSPDPEQEIPILLDLPLPEVEVETSTPEPTQAPSYSTGDTIPIRTGIIVDHNGHAVPDGTPVQFIFNLAGEVSFSAPVESTQGVAKISYVVNSPGRLEIRAVSEPANQSIPLQIDIPGPDNPPTEEPISTPTQTRTPFPSLEPTNTMAPSIEETPTTTDLHTKTDFSDWVLALVVTTGVGSIAYRLGARAGHTRWSIRWALSAIIGGILIYTLVATSLPGSEIVLQEGGRVAIIWLVFLGAIFGWGVGITWRAINNKDRISHRTNSKNL